MYGRSEIQYLKFSAVTGTTSSNSSKMTRPTRVLEIVMSKKQRGRFLPPILSEILDFLSLIFMHQWGTGIDGIGNSLSIGSS